MKQRKKIKLKKQNVRIASERKYISPSVTTGVMEVKIIYTTLTHVHRLDKQLTERF